MHNSTNADPVAALIDLLESERQFLLNGNLEALAALLPKKEALWGQIDLACPSDMPNLKYLEDRVRRNQGLLDSALAGIRAATDRLAAFGRLRFEMETYGSDGRKRTIDVTATSSVERRA